MTVAEVNTWAISRNGTRIGQVLRFEPSWDERSVISKSLGGTIYYQTIGSAVRTADVQAYATFEEKELFNKAKADGASITLVYRGVTYIGYPESMPSWSPLYPHEHYVGSFKMLIQDSY